MSKVVFFVFREEETCSIHVLLNALDGQKRGHTSYIVFEGGATGLIPLFSKSSHPLHNLYRDAKERGLIAGVCRACSVKMGVLKDVEEEKLPILDDMKGHPSIHRFLEEGFTVLTT
ncbi:MAG: cytoplasmic protein [Candidatus Caldatribacteriaceae bacterium]